MSICTIYPVKGEPYEEDIPDFTGLQAAVSGYVEVIKVDGDSYWLGNEDGLPKGMAVNEAASEKLGIQVVGPIVKAPAELIE